MKIYLPRSWVLTDEQYSTKAKGTPVLIDLETWNIYHPGDSIEGVPAQKVVSLAVEKRGENYLLPEELHFISRFKEGSREYQSVRGGHMGSMKELSYEEIEFLKRD
jgi:hypothetical protein